MAKKKGSKKKGSAKAAAGPGELLLLLPAEAYNEYKTIMATDGLGQETIDSILLAVFGTDPKFHINKVSIGNRDTFLTNPDDEPQTFKC